jgi:hypothetical protein
MPGALAPAGLKHVEIAALDGELHILHVAEVALQGASQPLQLLVGVRQTLLQLIDRERGAAAGYHVLTLGVDQELAIEPLLAGGRVAAEGDAGARVLAQVAEHHSDDVDRCPHGIRNVVELSVIEGPPGIPAFEHGCDGAPELVQRVGGEFAARFGTDMLLEPADHGLHFFDRQIDVALDPAALLVLLQNPVERLFRQLEYHGAVHLHEAAVGIPGEPGIAALLGQPFYRHVV